LYILPVYHRFSCLWLQFYCLLNHVHTACVPSVFLFVTTILLFIVSCAYGQTRKRMVHRPYVHDTVNNRIVVTKKKTDGTQAVCTCIMYIRLYTIRFLVCDYNSIVYCIMCIRPVYHPFSCLWLQFYCLLHHVHTACADGIQPVCTWYNKQ
jgi:hypothetical protein